MNKTFLLVVSTIIILLACRRDPPSTPATPPVTPATPSTPNTPQDTNHTTLSPSVYIAGDSFDLSERYLPYPVYWKNGKQVHLLHAGHSSGTGIAVSDSHVYVSSSGIYQGNNVTYWKNTTGINLADPTIISPTATGIALSGSDVYTVGGAHINNYQKFVPVYWKNEANAIKISTYSSSRGEGRAIAVSGNDVYIAGSTFDVASGYGSSPPCYWKNGTPTFLHSITPSSERGVAKSIYVSGADVHVAGEVYPIGSASSVGWAVYWKNGQATELAPSTKVSEANGITVVGNDVYIAGAVTGTDGQLHATYWKNGVAVTLDPRSSVANAIAVYENDVYVAGNRGIDSALYWKNGTPVLLGRGRARAIVVKK